VKIVNLSIDAKGAVGTFKGSTNVIVEKGAAPTKLYESCP
jgi:hypothetical protein